MFKKIFKGEGPGHPFRGNQYTRGNGGRGTPQESSPLSYSGEGAKLFSRKVSRIARLTDENFHGEAIVEGAKFLGRPDIASAVEEINKKHFAAGGLTTELSAQRTVQYDKLMDHAKKVLSPGDFAKFYKAF